MQSNTIEIKEFGHKSDRSEKTHLLRKQQTTESSNKSGAGGKQETGCGGNASPKEEYLIDATKSNKKWKMPRFMKKRPSKSSKPPL